ncbi:hypothetical protein PN498_02965 [Oscillatoria sp. CS-180]|uniref:nSTAND1 domain-containing NTPase n=1 Tax=Oscillatoria sp. CS-180 TaxID=3021720 RepID=UPI00232E6EE2|nr:hypothetical protein [Oscillatoria sp. CS-180]MDB9524936.1 hypothetical protein [Oscillatoria sp. CS-180]
MAGETGPIVGRSHSAEELLHFNQDSLTELKNVLLLSEGEFSLTLASCNYHHLRTLVNQALEQEYSAEVMHLPRQIISLRETIHQQLDGRTPSTLLIVGLDYLKESELRSVLQGANLSRDGFRKHFSFPIVLWMNRRVQQKFARYAPDFRSFSPAAIAFTLPPEELLYALHAGTDQIFSNVLERGGDRELTSTSIRLYASDAVRSELEFAVEDLRANDIVPDPSLQASLDFLRGREAHSRLEMDTARTHYEDSLNFWRSQIEPIETVTVDPDRLTVADKQAVLWLHLGLWWRSYAVVQRATYPSSLRQARRYFEKLIKYFRDRDQTVHLARFIHALAEVLQKQRDWSELEKVANKGISLHQETHDPIRLARDRGFLAEAALIREDWLTARSEAQQALDILVSAEDTSADTSEGVELANALEIAKSFQRGWYRFLLGEAQIHLGKLEDAVQYLEAARWETDPEVDLTLHLRVLNRLIDHYFDMGRYWEAFDVKQERRQVEYRYNLRAFVGAGAVQPHQRTSTKQFDEATQAAVAAEIRASGRLQDVEELAKRLEGNQHSIIVIHGPSGVGKSSILSAGLLPRTRTLYPKGRTTHPILIQTYGNWQQIIAEALTSLPHSLTPPLPHSSNPPTSLTEVLSLPTHPPIHPSTLLDQIRHGIDQNQFFILIFDQFEEFFFDKDDLAERRVFYDFLQQCLDQPFIKVVLALREDYLHHLVEVERIINLTSPDWDLLSRDVRYALANFKPAAAKDVIRQLTTAAQYPLPNDLIQRLVSDLSAETGDVRPIELQVVGAQLQRAEINTLAQYENLGDFPKEKLVQDYLTYVVRDCGPSNEKLAWVVLYLLTDEDREQRLFRPLKTREAIEYELTLLEMPFAYEQLSMVLSILVGSGLLFQIPQEPEDRYQLVHDYLVRYVRDVQTPGLMAELSAAKEREREALVAKQKADEKAALFFSEKNEALADRNEALAEKSRALEQRLTSQKRATAITGIGLGIVTLLGLFTYSIARAREFQ